MITAAVPLKGIIGVHFSSPKKPLQKWTRAPALCEIKAFAPGYDGTRGGNTAQRNSGAGMGKAQALVRAPAFVDAIEHAAAKASPAPFAPMISVSGIATEGRTVLSPSRVTTRAKDGQCTATSFIAPFSSTARAARSQASRSVASPCNVSTPAIAPISRSFTIRKSRCGRQGATKAAISPLFNARKLQIGHSGPRLAPA